MKSATALLLASLVALTACGDDEAANTPATQEQPDSSTARETNEALDAIGDAARETGEAARSAAEDAAEALGPTLDRAEEAGREALDAAGESVNDITRSAACQTARSADDAEGIAANCRE